MTADTIALVLSAVGLFVTVALAVLGYFATYYYNLRLTRKQQELDLVNRRMNEFYGPLYVWSQTGRMAIDAIQRHLGREQAKLILSDPTHPPTEDELREWRLWVQSVFMPLNLYLENLILEKAYLIREQEMPRCLLDFITHVSSYKPLLEKWANGNLTSHVPLIFFPEELNAYADSSYAEMKAEQIRLLNTLHKSKN